MGLLQTQNNLVNIEIKTALKYVSPTIKRSAAGLIIVQGRETLLNYTPAKGSSKNAEVPFRE